MASAVVFTCVILFCVASVEAGKKKKTTKAPSVATTASASSAASTTKSPVTTTMTILNGGKWGNGLSSIGLGQTTGVVVGSNFYVFGSSSVKTVVYNFASKTWATDLNRRPYLGGAHAVGASPDGLVFLFGGASGSPSAGLVQAYSPSVDAWEVRWPIPWAVDGSMVAVYLDGLFYVCGGNHGTTVLSRCGKYNPSLDTWVGFAANLPTGVKSAQAATDGSFIYVVGGSSSSASVNLVQRFSPKSNTWSQLSALPESVSDFGLSLIDNQLFIFGGVRSSTGKSSDNVLIYNLDSGVATNGPTMPRARTSMGVGLFGNTVGVVGGYLTIGSSSLVTTLTDILTLSFTPSSTATSMTASPTSDSSSTSPSTTTSTTTSTSSSSTSSSSTSSSSSSTSTSTSSSSSSSTTTTTTTTTTTKATTTTATTKKPSTSHSWKYGPSIAFSLGEVAAGVLGNLIFVWGAGSSKTLVFDAGSNKWLSSSPYDDMPYLGDHHSVVSDEANGKIYVVGGLSNNANGKMRVFTPSKSSGSQWTVLPDVPFKTGSANSVLINGNIYVCGGIVGGNTVNTCAAYDIKSNSWSSNIASMPKGVNHAAYETDGQYMYVFSGRGGGNVPSLGYSITQRYDPATNKWTSSLAPLPTPRGGTGHAVYANGLFYVMGGETDPPGFNGSTDKGVYDLVDVYNPSTNSWSNDAPLQIARHGIYPVLANNNIYVIGGGVKAGGSSSNIVEYMVL